MKIENITQFVGSQIKEHRIAMNLTQEALAQKAGLDRSYVIGIETGKRNITIVTLEKISAAINVNFFEIIAKNVDYSLQMCYNKGEQK